MNGTDVTLFGYSVWFPSSLPETVLLTLVMVLMFALFWMCVCVYYQFIYPKTAWGKKDIEESEKRWKESVDEDKKCSNHWKEATIESKRAQKMLNRLTAVVSDKNPGFFRDVDDESDAESVDSVND